MSVRRKAVSAVVVVLTALVLGKIGWPACADYLRKLRSTRCEGAQEIAAPAPREAIETEAWTGVLLTETAEIAARFDGRIARVVVRAGDEVVQGQVLVELDTSIQKHDIAAAEAGLRASQAEAFGAGVSLSAARERRNRRAGTVKVGNTSIAIVSEEEQASARYDSLSAASHAGMAAANAAERRARLESIKLSVAEAVVRAPFAGVISARYVDPGSQIHAGAPLVRLVGRSGMRVRFAIPDAEVSGIALGQRVVSRWDAQSLEATIDRIAPEIESASSTVFVEATIGALAGMPDRTALAGRVVNVVPAELRGEAVAARAQLESRVDTSSPARALPASRCTSAGGCATTGAAGIDRAERTIGGTP